MRFEVKSFGPKTTIEICSIIDFFNNRIIEDSIGGQDDEFHSRFVVDGDDKSLSVFLSSESISVSLLD